MAYEIIDKTQWADNPDLGENQELVTEDSQEGSSITEINIISDKMRIIKFMPPELSRHIQKLDDIVQTGIDTLATTNLSVLAALSGGTTIFDKKGDSTGTPVILYSASFFKSGGGKTVSASVNRHYFLDWQEEEYAKQQEDQDKEREMIEIELKSLSSSASDRDTKAELEKKLLSLKVQPDVYLEDATAEGFEASIACDSSPLLFIDNFGKYLGSANKSEHKANMLRMLDNIFDAGKTATRRLKRTFSPKIPIKTRIPGILSIIATHIVVTK
jgi:hypothetical protein